MKGKRVVRCWLLLLVGSLFFAVWQSALTQEPSDWPDPIVGQNNNTNQLIVVLDLDSPDVFRRITGVRQYPGNRARAEEAVVAAVNSGNSFALAFLHDPVRAKHLISDRLDFETRQWLGEDHPEERLHRYIVLAYRSIPDALDAFSALKDESGVLDVDLDKGFQSILPPSDPDRGGDNAIYPSNPRVLDDGKVQVRPDNATAYERLMLDFMASESSQALENQSVNIQVSGGDIYVEYLGDGAGAEETDYSLFTSIQGLPAGEYRLHILERHAWEEGSYGPPRLEVPLVIAESPPAQKAYTFFNPTTNHYFVTASEDERDKVLDWGWYSADPGFHVWPPEGPAPEAAEPVCRFYNERVNSHFYTASREECEFLKDPAIRWRYEGLAFQALVSTEGACPAGTDAVWRLYNDRAEENDSNHRFVASGETYRAMVADGWKGEGVAFCSPPASSE